MKTYMSNFTFKKYLRFQNLTLRIPILLRTYVLLG